MSKQDERAYWAALEPDGVHVLPFQGPEEREEEEDPEIFENFEDEEDDDGGPDFDPYAGGVLFDDGAGEDW